ncbi:MAG: DUF3142 domain-containing protein [Bryobacteraceae bacterium]
MKRAALVTFALLLGCHRGSEPRRMLWAWERPEDLRFLDPAVAGVAYLAGTIHLERGETRVDPRRQPLELAEGAHVIGVVRIEAGRDELVESQRERAVSVILELTDRPAVRGIQVDFDVALSQRAFYRQLLVDLRRRIPAGRGLSMTALASWCIHDHWINGLPVDEAVPMVFRMGADDRVVRQYLDSRRDFLSPLCKSSFGVAADEPWPRIPRGRRIWLFAPRAWTKESVGSALFALRKD